jgi:leucyl aminopeptidase
MNLLYARALACALILALVAPRDGHAGVDASSSDFGADPHAAVYIVTSTDIYQSDLQAIVGNGKGIGLRDSLGTPLVLAEVEAWQVDEISRVIHEQRRRCGGFFAFGTRAEAEAFVRGDASRQAAQAKLASYTIDNATTVNPWLPQASEANIRGTIATLSGNTNRYYTSSTGKTSAEWIRSRWQALAGTRTDVSTELSTCGTCSTQPSVILTINGNELPGEIVVLGAHLDSINTSGGGSTTQVAPGADDDASGVATLTEVIRIALASGWKPKRTVQFMAYAAEEVGLRGSNAIAQSFKNSGKNVVGMLQLDMTNYKSGSVADMQLISDYSNAGLKTFLTNLFDTYLAPSGLTRSTYTCGYGCSDHASWTSAGFPAAMMFEGGSSSGYNPNIHGPNDTLANMGNSAANSVKFAKLALAFVGELAKTTGGGTPANQAPVANFSFSASGLTASFTDRSTDADGSIASRSWNFGDGGTSTATNPSRTYAAAGTYTVTLTVTDNAGATHSKSSAVTVSSGTALILSNGVPVNNLAAAAGSSVNYVMNVPAGATGLKFVASGGTGDADLYVKFGSAPTDSSYDCRPYQSGNNETCNIATAQAGTYYVRLKAYSAFSGVSLTGSYSTGTPPPQTQTYSNATDYPIKDNTTVDSPIAVAGRSGNAPSAASVTVDIVHTYQGDLKVDLVAPDGSLYNIHNRTGSGTDNIKKTVTLNLSSELLNGTWKLRVNDNGAGDTGYINSWSITM